MEMGRGGGGRDREEREGRESIFAFLKVPSK